MAEAQLHQLIKGCLMQDRASQKLLYKTFYGFAMAICLRYAGNRDTAAEVMNQGFLKVFTNIKSYDPVKPFKAWLGRIMVNVSIDHYRANHKLALVDDLDAAEHVSDGELPDRKLNYEDLLAMVQKLPQSYRTVFNLFAIEGFSHEEISDMLHISTGASKSNLHKARAKLKDMILHADATANRSFGSTTDYHSMVAIKSTDINNVTVNKNIR